MNKVKERCSKNSIAKFLYASKKISTEVKYVKILMYLFNIAPVVICFLPTSDETTKLICSCISFGLTLINEVAVALLNNYKEKAVLLQQLYEAEITGSSFSKIEYDREYTNDLNELAIRKGLPKMQKVSNYPVTDVPQQITDDYSYLYIIRCRAAKTRYLIGHLFYVYSIILITIALVFISLNFSQKTTGQTLYTLICIWPLIIPLIRNLLACKKSSRQSVKVCADIDNFFADGDDSIERLARFYYYVQNIEFDMMVTTPTIFNFIKFCHRNGTSVLINGVTQRFEDAIVELKGRKLVYKGVIAQPHGRELITKTDIDMDYIQNIKKASKAKKDEKPVKAEPKKKEVKMEVKKPAVKKEEKKVAAKKEDKKTPTKPVAKQTSKSKK